MLAGTEPNKAEQEGGGGVKMCTEGRDGGGGKGDEDLARGGGEVEVAIHQRGQVVGVHMVVTHNGGQGSNKRTEVGGHTAINWLRHRRETKDGLRDPTAKPGGEAAEVTAVQDGRPGGVANGTQEERRKEPRNVRGAGPRRWKAGEGVASLSRPPRSEHTRERERTAEASGSGGEGAYRGGGGRNRAEKLSPGGYSGGGVGGGEASYDSIIIAGIMRITLIKAGEDGVRGVG